jgi:excisionase family DNA binding protein
MRPSTSPHRRYASLKDAGLYVGLSQWTIRRRIADGTLTGYRIGRAIRVDLNEVDDRLVRIPSAGAA